jgi:hypothetical protein
MVWVFVNPDLFGPGYIVSTAGVMVVGATLLATIYYSLVGERRREIKRTTPFTPAHVPTG